MIISYCVGLFFLALLTAEDIKKKEISVYKVLIFICLFFFYRICSGQILWEEILWGLIPGGVLILLAFCTGEGIGYGDGAAVIVLGLWTGGWFALAAVWIGITLAGIYGAFRLAKGSREPVAFIPFLLLGMEVVLFYA